MFNEKLITKCMSELTVLVDWATEQHINCIKTTLNKTLKRVPYDQDKSFILNECAKRFRTQGYNAQIERERDTGEHSIKLPISTS
jgi:hypothetical protein